MTFTISDTLQGLASAAMLGTSLLMIVSPSRWQNERSKRQERLLADRLTHGNDRYFEELRTLESYSKPFNPRTIRTFGVALLILSFASFTLILFK